MKLSQSIIEASIKIHQNLGPGLLESVYQDCLVYELTKKNIKTSKEVMIPVQYETLNFQSGFRADLIVEDKIILEIKSIEKIAPVHKSQVLTYLKLSQYPLALLINFGDKLLRDGIHRFASGEAANDL